MTFQTRKYELFNINEILPASYFEGADFKSDIRFRKFRAQIPKFGGFGPKSIKFLNLIKLFYFYLNSTVVISIITFEQKSATVGIMGQNQSMHLRGILLKC